MTDMKQAVQRLQERLRLGGKMVFYGDYDLDGTEGVVSLYLLHCLGMSVSYFIPKQLKESYRITEPTLRRLKSYKTRLLIIVDNGAKASAAAASLWRIGVTDDN